MAKQKKHVAYSEEVADKLIDEIANGKSLSKIEKMPGMPCKRSIIFWSMGEKGAPDNFPIRYARAFEMRAESQVDDMLDVVRQAEKGKIDVNAARLHVDTIKWLASKHRPKVYADSRDIRLHTEPQESMRDRLERAKKRLMPKRIEATTVEYEDVTKAIEVRKVEK